MCPEAVTVSVEIDPPESWLSWIGATTACLRALGVDCDHVDVAGYSSYAFSLSINRGLCPSGPTSVNWSALANGPNCLGRTAIAFTSWDCHTKEAACDRTREHCRVAFEIIKREISEERPCVAWGLGVPEFGVVRGFEGDDLLCVEAGPTPARVRFDEIEAPGGPAVFAFPSESRGFPEVDRFALHRALAQLAAPSSPGGSTLGIAAWDYWVENLERKEAVTWSNSYNAQCWAEARGYARDFVGRLAEKHEPVGAALHQAHAAFTKVSEHLDAVAAACPFDMKFNADPLTDDLLIEEVATHLRYGKLAELKAIEAMQGALRGM